MAAQGVAKAARQNREAEHTWDLLLVVTSDRYGTAMFGTVRRMIEATLSLGRSVQVWACGYSTLLTQRHHAGDAAREIGDLVSESADRFSWLACADCSADRDVGGHIDGVPSPSLSEFRGYIDAAAKVVFIGGA